MARNDAKTEELFPQKRVPAIESAILACDKKKAEIAKVMEMLDGGVDENGKEFPGLKAELKDLEAGLRKALHANEDKIDRQETPDQLPVLIYKRGDYEAKVAAHERLTYEKVRDASAGEASE